MVNLRQEGHGHRTLARSTDSETSHDAAGQVTGRKSLIERVTRFVEAYPGKTRGEIADGLDEPQERVWRRVSDAVNQGKVLYGAPRLYDGRKQQTVWPIEYQSKQFLV